MEFQVKISPYTYKLFFVPGSHPNLEGDEGFINHHSLEIYVNSDLNPRRAVMAVVHECLHAIFDVTNLLSLLDELSESSDKEERIVDVLEGPVLAFLEDNKDLLATLLELENEQISTTTLPIRR